MLSKPQKAALAVIVVALLAMASLLLALPMLEKKPATYSAVVDVKIFGPGWVIVAEDVGIDNATVLVALQTAGRNYGFNVSTTHYTGMGDLVTGINGTSGNMTHFWLYGVNGVSGDVGADQKVVYTGDVVVWWYTDDFSSQPPGD
ncbi:MAG: DUF4430 domain-containing protein [Euryarchaeota archaeon]|nr:DUF4430 domain-containing protein [Euryarchaeota archaeon]